MKMKIAFFETQPWEKEMFEAKKSPGWNVSYFWGKLDNNNLPIQKDFDVVSIFVGSNVDAETVGAFPNLQLIAARSTGYDHIDLAAAQEKKVVTCYVPGYGDNTVAEYAFGLLLALTRKIYLAVDRVKERGAFSFDGLQGVDLKGKTIGVVGTGRIGREVIAIAKGFGMTVVACDPFPFADAARDLGFSYVPLDKLLSSSDVVTLHAPYTPQTHHILDRKAFAAMKRGAYLVNTARGALVDTAALVEALQNGTLAGAALDVLEEEGFVKDEINLLISGHPKEEQLKNALANHVLMEMENVLISPHNAFNSREAIERIISITVDNIKGFETGTPQNVVK